jgi:phage shock protein PspC (stress-responsive transcriptional regulator)
MKKIININLSGRVIPIEDSAYEKLQAYVESLRRYFANEEGRDEIINDIESRIAELMSEKIRKGASSITDSDVNDIASSMGRPEDFEAEEVKEKEPQQKKQSIPSPETETTSSSKSKRGRFYRNPNDKFLGGVCSGLANYLDVDPAVVRLLVAIFGFAGWGILIYIALWIFIPEKEQEGYTGKRFYRNSENKVLGGVASGLAAYFNKEVRVFRLIFVAPFILNILFGIFRWPFHAGGFWFPNVVFGSLTGTFVLAYIVLWIILPEAKSQYEKMEMRGEKVDVNAIKQNVQEGMGTMKDKMKNWGEEVKTTAENIGAKAKEFSNTQGKAFAEDVKQNIRPVAHGIGHAFGVLFKVFFLFIAGCIAFGLFVALMAVIFGGVAWWPVNNFLWTSNWQQVYAWGTLILFLGVPLIGFLIWLIRRIIGIKSKSSYLGWTFGGLWTLGWLSVILLIASISKDVRYYEHSTPVEVSIPEQPANNKMIVAVTEPALEFTDRYWWVDSDSEGWDISEDTLKMSFVRFHVIPSLDSSYHVMINKYSAGRSSLDVNNRADKIQYHASYANGILDLGSGFAIDKDSKYRGQMVEVEIKVPTGKKIRFDESVRHKLNPVNIRVQKNRGWRRGRVGINVEDYDSFPWEVNTDYIMGTDGELKNADGTPVKRNGYRYQDDDSIQIEKSIEEKKNEIKELELQKKEQIQQKQKNSASKDSAKTENMEDGEDNEFNIKGTPIFSLVQLFY